MNISQSVIAFSGTKCIAAGSLLDVVAAVKQALDQGAEPNMLIFDDVTSEPVEVDFRGSLNAVLARLPTLPEDGMPVQEEGARMPGRPKLGVVSREVTLLPRHWEWLGTQPGGASVALRKLVEAASRANEIKDRRRLAQESSYRFMSAMAGNLPGYEEAVRALFADRPEQFGALTEDWPIDVRDQTRSLALKVFLPQSI